MANWQRHVYLNPEWKQAKNYEITPQQLAASIAKKLRAITPFKAELGNVNDELAEIADEFEWLGENESTSINDIDGIMHTLYDWGDQWIDSDWNGKKVCWVDAHSAPHSPSTEQPPCA